MYQFNVPTFGPGVVFDVDYSVRMEQFRFFTEALTVKRLKSYVEMMVEEAEVLRCHSYNTFTLMLGLASCVFLESNFAMWFIYKVDLL